MKELLLVASRLVVSESKIWMPAEVPELMSFKFYMKACCLVLLQTRV